MTTKVTVNGRKNVPLSPTQLPPITAAPKRPLITTVWARGRGGGRGCLARGNAKEEITGKGGKEGRKGREYSKDSLKVKAGCPLFALLPSPPNSLPPLLANHFTFTVDLTLVPPLLPRHSHTHLTR